jgi:DNA-binding transcriptional MerR regulator
MQFIPKKLYYKIREVCEIVGVEAHVLRFWETEFPALAPPKTKTGQRIYRPKDIDLLLRIRKLLYEDGFTIPGARKQLSASGSPQVGAEAVESAEVHGLSRPESNPEPAPASELLRRVRAELENMLTLLDRE